MINSAMDYSLLVATIVLSSSTTTIVGPTDLGPTALSLNPRRSVPNKIWPRLNSEAKTIILTAEIALAKASAYFPMWIVRASK